MIATLIGKLLRDCSRSLPAKDLKVNLIMTDYSMPGMTGFELLKKIKISSTFREIPVVIMSSENILTRIDRSNTKNNLENNGGKRPHALSFEVTSSEIPNGEAIVQRINQELQRWYNK